MKKEGVNLYFGCYVCFQFGSKKTMFSKELYPLHVELSDISNKTASWRRCRDSYRHHNQHVEHIDCMARANDSDYFNKLALKNQLLCFMHLVENGDPDIRYPALTHLIQHTRGFVEEIGTEL